MHGNVIVVVEVERGEEPDKIRHSGKQRGNVLKVCSTKNNKEPCSNITGIASHRHLESESGAGIGEEIAISDFLAQNLILTTLHHVWQLEQRGDEIKCRAFCVGELHAVGSRSSAIVCSSAKICSDII